MCFDLPANNGQWRKNKICVIALNQGDPPMLALNHRLIEVSQRVFNCG